VGELAQFLQPGVRGRSAPHNTHASAGQGALAWRSPLASRRHRDGAGRGEPRAVEISAADCAQDAACGVGTASVVLGDDDVAGQVVLWVVAAFRKP
jgi:hypothetical protein